MPGMQRAFSMAILSGLDGTFPDRARVLDLTRQVVNMGISLLLQAKCSRRFNNYRPCDRYTYLAHSRRNRDGMVRPGDSDLLAFVRLCLHCAPRGTSYSFDPPSAGMLAPVVQPAPSDGPKKTTSAVVSLLSISFHSRPPTS